MRTSSCKAKGRRACQEFQQLILRWFPDLTQKDVRVTPSGVTGADIQLSQAAEKVFPYAIEVKNQEKLNIWQSLDQTQRHADGLELKPLLAFRRNRSQLYVALKAEHFFELAGIVDSEKASPQKRLKSKLDALEEEQRGRFFGYGDDE